AMKWELDWNDPFTHYLESFETLVGDRRTRTTLTETVKGIISSGSLVCTRIAAHSPILGAVKKGAQRIIRMVRAETTKRSPDLDAFHLTAQLRTHALAQLGQQKSDELWLIAFWLGLGQTLCQRDAAPHESARSLWRTGQWLSDPHRIGVDRAAPRHSVSSAVQ